MNMRGKTIQSAHTRQCIVHVLHVYACPLGGVEDACRGLLDHSLRLERLHNSFSSYFGRQLLTRQRHMLYLLRFGALPGRWW